MERQIRDLGVTDGLLLLRAKAIDKATQNLLAHAQDASPAAADAAAPQLIRQAGIATSTAAAVAGQSFPEIGTDDGTRATELAQAGRPEVLWQLAVRSGTGRPRHSPGDVVRRRHASSGGRDAAAARYSR
jgi:hypothetical protein